ncbi:MAG: hypothetical protein II875_07320 [Clostridia bacterium]|nr:hypothetical protein [Clostridia bacterium]
MRQPLSLIIGFCAFCQKRCGVFRVQGALLRKEGEPEKYVFHDPQGNPLSQATFKRMWCRLMADARCATVRDYDPHEEKNWDILKQVKPTLTPHFLRHNYVTLLYEAGVDPLIAMKIRRPHGLQDHREHLHAR